MACTPEAQAFVTEGEACQARGAFHEAVRAWQRAIAADDACAAAYAAWGRALAERRLPREAIPKFAAALLRDATVADVWDALGAALSALDAAGPEIERLRRLVRQIASADAWSRWGTLLLEREEWAPAEEAFRSAIAKSATARDHVGLARALHGGGQIPEAASALLRALEIEPGLPEIHEALRRWVLPRRAPADDPAVVDVLARFGAAVDRLGSAAALAQWARVLHDRGQHEAALDAYARAESQAPLTAADLWPRASSFAARDRWDEALVALERALERVKAGDGIRWRRRFRGRDPLHGMSDERIARLRAFAAGLDDAAVFLELGRFLRTTLDRPDEALEAYDAAARKDPTRSEALLDAIYLLNSLERAEGSSPVLSRRCGVTPMRTAICSRVPVCSRKRSRRCWAVPTRACSRRIWRPCRRSSTESTGPGRMPAGAPPSWRSAASSTPSVSSRRRPPRAPPPRSCVASGLARSQASVTPTRP
jgi:tetratricopeptide (TPR) repeat protein